MLVPRLSSVLFLLIVIYYFFAIIGMEFLFGKVEPGCWYVCHMTCYTDGDDVAVYVCV